MPNITEVQQAILSLPEADYLQLRHWFSELDWDRQIETDSENGKLDFLIAEAFEEETSLFSNHSANLIEEWHYDLEDEVWKQGETQ